MTISNSKDTMWEHFLPLWTSFQADSGGEMLIAGGYGLFLKQLWLRDNQEIKIVVPLESWLDVTPRITKDLDLVVSLDLI